MASLTPTIKDTSYSTKLIDGMLKFDIEEDKIYFSEKNNSQIRNIIITSPSATPNTIILNETKFNESNSNPIMNEDTVYYDTLEYSIQYQQGSGNFSKKIPRTEYLEKVFTPSVSTSTILVFNSYKIDAVNTEIDVRIIDPNGNFIEPTNVSVAYDMCTVTVPPYLALSNTICRLYIYNPNDFNS